MLRFGMLRFVALAFVLSLVGCGSSASDFNLAQPGLNSSLSGRVVNEQGAGVTGVLVVARERTTSQGVTARSGADGSFQVSAPPGVYDLSFDLQGDSQTATCYYGPVDSTAGTQRDFVLRNRNGRSDDTVFGKIELVPGSPAANRRLELRPGYARNFTGAVLPDSLASLTTQPDGSFEVALGHRDEIGFDLEIFDGAGALDEWIKVDKFPKPCYVQVASEQSPVVSLLRVNQTSTVAPSSSPAGAVGPAINDPFDLVADSNGGLSLLQGILPVQARTGFQLALLVKNPGAAVTDFQKSILQGSTIELTGDVDFPFSIIYSYQINLTAGAKSNWEFTDETGDTYKLAVIVTDRGHTLRYNSKGPKILSMKVSPR